MSDSENQARAQYESIKRAIAALDVDYDRLAELPRLIDEAGEAHKEACRVPQAVPNADVETFQALQALVSEYDELRELAEANNGEGYPFKNQDDAYDGLFAMPLACEVRSGWMQVSCGQDFEPEEFRILLCTGGPAVQIRGTFGTPVTVLQKHTPIQEAWIEHQDWGTPWTRLDTDDIDEAVLKRFADLFFGN